MRNIFVLIISGIFMCSAAFAQQEKKEDNITVSLDSFYGKLSRQAMPQIIDARSPDEFAFNHINGAINFNLQSTDYSTFVKALDKTKPVFIYSINTGRSSALGRELKRTGFTMVYDLEGGIANWIGGGKAYYTSSEKGLSLAGYQNIVANNKTVLVDIGSRYCGACKKAKFILDTLKKENGNAIKIVEVDLEESPHLITALNTVNVFPYLILYNKGEIVLKRGGLNALKNDIDEALAKTRQANGQP